MRTRSLNGTPLMPASQTFLFNWGSRRTSVVPYCRLLVFYVLIPSTGCPPAYSYHGLCGEFLDLLDGFGCALLECNTVKLSNNQYASLVAPSNRVCNVLSCGGGLCIRAQRHRRWRIVEPCQWRASWSWSTFLGRVRIESSF